MDGDPDWPRTREPSFNPYAPPEPVEEPPEPAPAGPLPGSPPGLSVTYRNNAADIAAYAEYYTSKFTKQRRNLRLMMGLILTVLVSQAVLFRAPHRERFQAPIMIVAIVGGWIWMEFASPRRKTTLPAEMPLRTLTLTPSGIVTRDERGGGARRAWAAIPRIDQFKDHIGSWGRIRARRARRLDGRLRRRSHRGRAIASCGGPGHGLPPDRLPGRGRLLP